MKRQTCTDDTDGTHLISGLAQGLQINLIVHVVLLQLKQSCLMLIVHHPPATQHSQSQDMTYCAKCFAPRPVQTLLEIHNLFACCQALALAGIGTDIGIVLFAYILPGHSMYLFCFPCSIVCAKIIVMLCWSSVATEKACICLTVSKLWLLSGSMTLQAYVTSLPSTRVPRNNIPDLVALDAASKHAHKNTHHALSSLCLRFLPHSAEQFVISCTHPTLQTPNSADTQ